MDFKHIPHPAPVPGETRAEAIADPGMKLPTGEVLDQYWLKRLGKI